MAFYAPSHDFIQVPPQEAYFEPINWYRTKLHELTHNAERRITPRGGASALRTLAPTVRQVGIVSMVGGVTVRKSNRRFSSEQFAKAPGVGNFRRSKSVNNEADIFN